jgi:hypothetical protein
MNDRDKISEAARLMKRNVKNPGRKPVRKACPKCGMMTIGYGRLFACSNPNHLLPHVPKK